MNVARVSKLATITRLAAKQDVSVDEVISHLLDQYQSLTKVARKLDVNPNAVRYHALRLGYEYDPETRRWTRPN